MFTAYNGDTCDCKNASNFKFTTTKNDKLLPFRTNYTDYLVEKDNRNWEVYTKDTH